SYGFSDRLVKAGIFVLSVELIVIGCRREGGCLIPPTKADGFIEVLDRPIVVLLVEPSPSAEGGVARVFGVELDGLIAVPDRPVVVLLVVPGAGARVVIGLMGIEPDCLVEVLDGLVVGALGAPCLTSVAVEESTWR